MNVTAAALLLSERMNGGSKSRSSPGGFLKRSCSFPLEAFISRPASGKQRKSSSNTHLPACTWLLHRSVRVSGALSNSHFPPPLPPRGSNKNISIISRSPISRSPRRLATKSTDAFGYFFLSFSATSPWAGGNHLKSRTFKVPKEGKTHSKYFWWLPSR